MPSRPTKPEQAVQAGLSVDALFHKTGLPLTVQTESPLLPQTLARLEVGIQSAKGEQGILTLGAQFATFRMHRDCAAQHTQKHVELLPLAHDVYVTTQPTPRQRQNGQNRTQRHTVHILHIHVYGKGGFRAAAENGCALDTAPVELSACLQNRVFQARPLVYEALPDNHAGIVDVQWAIANPGSVQANVIAHIHLACNDRTTWPRRQCLMSVL